MYSVGDYPIVVKTQSPAETVVVEVFEIQSNKVCQEIEAMEIEAGYYIDIITLQGQKVAIFLFKESNGFKEVEGGNWHKYFKMSHK